MASLLLVGMPFAPSSFLLLVVRMGQKSEGWNGHPIVVTIRFQVSLISLESIPTTIFLRINQHLRWLHCFGEQI